MNKIYVANYCEIDSDCVTIENRTFFCDKYNINRKELDNIKKNMDLYNSFALFDNNDVCEVIISLEPKCNKDTKRCKQAENLPVIDMIDTEIQKARSYSHIR